MTLAFPDPDPAPVHVLVVGLHARLAPLALRERVAFVPGDQAATQAARAAGVPEALVLSTCNRVEVYVAGPRAALDGAADRLLAFLAERAGVEADRLRAHAFVQTGAAAARHLCRVSAGLDSVMLGETQIVGQLKRAAAEAREERTLGGTLQRLVCTALAAGRRAGAPLAPAAGPTSVAQDAVRAVPGAGAVAGRVVVVLGAGETAAEVLRLIEQGGAKRVVVVNRSSARGSALAWRHGADSEAWEARAVVLATADVVFACTAAPSPVVTRAHLAPDVAGPPRGPRLVVDLGVPRNVEPDVAALPGVALWDVDALAGSPGAARDAEEAEAEAARWAARYERWLAARPTVVPTIARLRESADRVRDRELQRALARLEGLGEREQAVVRELATRLVNKLLHPPMVALATAPESAELTETAHRLFGFAPEPALEIVEAAGPSRSA
ncbi:glutamyl-tRNA reductase [Roseisolibacter sp. H3M3-2]|uniref:glutamyl-tRNA reductase n=1 Tax=Roseisolibacter sp. H3M3-2 TaxID=3031323 RepID=UPI0023DAB84B|nr:glutamyl-tRNA reductase [Roseisolibacter sp. H3M3-2]MDF1502398.1 glutamyl-tRNA reductase [Roseisolibacter sp. H3M3-2]